MLILCVTQMGPSHVLCSFFSFYFRKDGESKKYIFYFHYIGFQSLLMDKGIKSFKLNNVYVFSVGTDSVFRYLFLH